MFTKYVEKVNWVNSNWETIKGWSYEDQYKLAFELTDMVGEVAILSSNAGSLEVINALLELVTKVRECASNTLMSQPYV